MGIRFRSYSVYGLGYCPTMSWSAMIIVNSVCDTCTSFATRLRFDLYTFWEIFGWVWLWSLCVQQFWACKFMVSLCLLLSVQRREVRWRETSRMIFWSHLVVEFDRMIFLVIIVAECECIEFDYMEMETELMYVSIVEWGVGLADDQTAACLVCRRIDDCSGLPYYIRRNCVVSTYHSVQW